MIGSRSPRPIGRPRDEQVREAILDAVLAILERDGCGQLTLHGVSVEAAVSRQTLYTWWTSKGGLILDAMLHAARSVKPRFNGPLGGDVQHFLESTFAAQTPAIREALRALIAEAQHDAAFREEFRDRFVRTRRGVAESILEEAIRRGEVAPNADRALFVDLLFGPMWYRLLVQHAPVDRRFARELGRLVEAAFVIANRSRGGTAAKKSSRR